MKKVNQLEEMLHSKLERIDKKYLSHMTETEKAKVDGMKNAVEECLVFLKLRSPISKESVTAFFGPSISKEIYSLMRNEEKYSKQKTKRLECKIAYHESVVETLQILLDNFLELET